MISGRDCVVNIHRKCSAVYQAEPPSSGFGVASIVYAIDASAIAVQASEVVKANNLSETDVDIEEEVDVIISEWMGYMLLYESMLGSVIIARDRWLKPGGLILPSNAILFMAPVTHVERYSESIDFWRNVYGIDMSAMVPLAKQCAFEEPSVETITGENILTWPAVVRHVDCYTVTVQELESFTVKYKFKSMMKAQRMCHIAIKEKEKGIKKETKEFKRVFPLAAPFNGFAFWFDVEFRGPALVSNSNHLHFPDHIPSPDVCVKKKPKSDDTLVLSTSPEEAPTHWQQTLIYFYDPIELEQDQVIEGSITVSQSKENARFLNIHLEYACILPKDSSSAEQGGSPVANLAYSLNGQNARKDCLAWVPPATQRILIGCLARNMELDHLTFSLWEFQLEVIMLLVNVVVLYSFLRVVAVQSKGGPKQYC
ncbi:putative protein arginine N-methyltransferase 6 [Asimina triloba]